ncbi:MAG: M15 family metallopeptidase [Alphaproteobacteria bacterium]|nr:M15 family metallopeptidase [Alphaproteobacteria bacterium]
MLICKPYHQISIRDCGEPLVALPMQEFAFFPTHAYVAAGAPYNGQSPWMLRQSVLESLRKAQKRLKTLRPGWNLMLFDAYRPQAVQAYMVEYELTLMTKQAGLTVENLSAEQRAAMMEKILRIYAEPSDDPATPPPHSTGAAVDCTLADEKGREAWMGSPIDENSDRSNPDHFATAEDTSGKRAHTNRTLLHDIMRAEGFSRDGTEWWHFSKGDQMAVWRENKTTPPVQLVAIYGRADL